MMSIGRRLACGLLVAAAVSGCRREVGRGPATTQPAQPVEKSAERGPVRLTVRLNKDRITIAEPFELSIEARAAPGVEVEMPRFGEGALAQFAIRDFRERSPKPDDAERVWRQTYTLDSFVSGTFEIPGIEVRFTDSRPAQATATTQPAIHSSVRTEALAINVASLLEGQFDPQKFNDIKGPATLPRSWPQRALGWAAAGFAALAVIGGAVWYWRSRRGRERMVRMPPHQWALLELERLLAEDLIGRGEVVEFYYRLNGLVRQYIELRFGLEAPEQTSEEFLRALDCDPRLPAEHRQSLREFVTACDPVKYARYAPGREEIEAVFAAARDFVLQTRQREQEVELAPVEAAA